MNTQTSDLQVLEQRIKKLENQNRRMKRVGAAVLILSASVLLMGQAPASRTVEANEFILRDSAGRMRGSLSMDLGLVPELALFDENGREQFSVEAIGLRGAVLSMGDMLAERGALLANDSERGAYLRLSDKEGFQTTIGSADLITPQTGERHTTSAASVVLVDKDKKVIWQAP